MTFNVKFSENEEVIKGAFADSTLLFGTPVDKTFSPTSPNAQSGVAIANTFANALKGNKSGEIVSMTDVSPIEHNVGVKVKGKNLFDMSILSSGYFKLNDDGTVTFQLPSTSMGATYGNKTLKELVPQLEVGKTYIFTAETTGENKYIYLNAPAGRGWFFGKSLTITENDLNSTVMFYASGNGSSCVFSNMQIEEGTTATAYAPYVEDLSAVSVKRYGKNLCDLGTVKIEEKDNGRKFCKLNHPLKAGVSYFLSAFVESTDTDDKYSSINLRDNNNSHISGHWVPRGNANEKINFTPTRDVYGIDFLAATDATKSVGDTGTFSNILIATQDNDATYEPFIEPTTYTPNADGTVEGVTSLYPSMTLMTDSGVIIDAEYNRDINKAFAELQNAVINMGGIL